MSIKKFILTAIFLSFSASVSADNNKDYVKNGAWQYVTKKDEMRGTSDEIIMQSVPSLDEPKIFATLAINLGKDRIYRLSLLTDKPINCTKDCKVSAKFDDSKINEYLIRVNREPTEDRAYALFSDSSALIGAALKASVIYIELPILNLGMKQFKFNLKGLHINQQYSPLNRKNISLGNLTFGKKIIDIPKELEVYKKDGKLVCYKSKKIDSLIPGFKDKENDIIQEICFFDNYLSSITLSPFDKKSAQIIKTILNQSLGNPDIYADLSNWPKSDDRFIETKTLSASYWNLGRKNHFEGLFSIRDETIEPLIPAIK